LTEHREGGDWTLGDKRVEQIKHRIPPGANPTLVNGLTKLD